MNPPPSPCAILGLIRAAHANAASADQSARLRRSTHGNVHHQTNAPQSAKDIIRQMKTGQKVRVTYEANASAAYVSDVQPTD